ncbi:MAG: hypothetical protein AMJ76_02950 [Dehalococcoidia bacterium SM23_28_1]|nr:MAG: hypothetical protein AMJ76_02950 [Dehalococcoidia bacterium SM23_28_1]
MFTIEVLRKTRTTDWQRVTLATTTAEAVAYIKANGPHTGGRYGVRRLPPCPICRNKGSRDGLICTCPAGEHIGDQEAALDAAIMASLGK